MRPYRQGSEAPDKLKAEGRARPATSPAPAGIRRRIVA